LDPEDPKILDYATAPPPLKRRDALEYYREPPISSGWGIGQIVIFIVCLIAGVIGFLFLLAHLLYGL
jgi:hypothetical protein